MLEGGINKVNLVMPYFYLWRVLFLTANLCSKNSLSCGRFDRDCIINSFRIFLSPTKWNAHSIDRTNILSARLLPF